jgi:hypothetical protein
MAGPGLAKLAAPGAPNNRPQGSTPAPKRIPMNHRLPVTIALIILTGIAWLALAPPPAWAAKTYADRNLGYSLTLPEHWAAQVKPGSGGRSLVFSGAKGTQEYATTISLQVLPRKAYADLTTLAGDLVSQWQRLPDYKLLARQKGKLAGRPALRLLVEYHQPGGKQTYRQEQFACLGDGNYYLLAYTAPVSLFERFRPHLAQALDSFALSGGPGQQPSPPRQEPSPGYRDKMLAATYGPAIIKQAGGPLYAPSYDNGTYQGRQVASAVQSMVGSQSRVLVELAKRQALVLAVYDTLGAVQAKQAALLEAELDSLPAEVKKLFKLQAEYAILQRAQRGAVQGALDALPPPEKVSNDLAGVQALAALQAGLSDQQALILRQNQEVWSAGMLTYQDLSKDSSGLPAHTRLKLAQLNAKQQKAALKLIQAVDAMNTTMASLVMVLDLWGEFQLQVGRAYGAELASALPRLEAEAQRLRRVKPNDPALAVIQTTIKALGRVRQNLEMQPMASLRWRLWQYLGDMVVPPAYAGAWDFTKRFAENAYYAGRIGITATLNVPRLAAQGLGHSAERLGQELSYGSIKKLNVTSDPEAILPSADEIIKRNPKMAKHRDKLVAALKKIKKRHRVENAKGYLKLKKDTIDANVAEYRSKKYGARALGGAVKSIDALKNGVETGVQNLTQEMVRGVAGDLAANTVGWATGKINGFAAGIAYGVVAEIPKSVAVLLNPKSSWSEHAKAYYDLASSMGAAVTGMGKTAVAVTAKVLPRLTKVLKGGAKLVGRMIPKGSKAAGMADDVLAPVLKKGRELSKVAVKKVRQMDSGIAKKIKEGVKSGVDKVKDLAAKPLGQTVKGDLKNIVKDVTKNLKAKDGEMLKNFAQNFSNKGLLENAANGTFSDNALKPILDAAENAASAEPAKTKASQASSGFSSKATSGGQAKAAVAQAEPKKTEKPKAKPKPKPKKKKKAKRRKETQQERKKRKADLMARAKKRAARMKNPDYVPPKNDSTMVIEQDCTIDVVMWIKGKPQDKWPSTFYIRGGQVSGTFGYTYSYQKHCTDTFCCASSRTTGTFSGSLLNNVISGTWDMKHHPHNCWHIVTHSDKGADGKYTQRTTKCNTTRSGVSTQRINLTLGMNNQVEETWSSKYDGTTSYGPGCWKGHANTTKTHQGKWVSWDDPVYKGNNYLFVGVWEKRKRPKAEDEEK